MKLVPLFGFLSRKRVVEDDEDMLEELIAEQLKPPTEEIVESEEEEPESEEEEEEEEKEETEGAEMSASTDDMLKVFVATEEEFTDMSSLVTEVEDVPAAELLVDLRQIAAAFNIRLQNSDGE
jgi:hypothetical protein